MKKQTLKEYLLSVGVGKDTPSEEVAAAKAAYRKQYLKEKKRERRMTHTSVTLSFPNKEAGTLIKEAEGYRMKLPGYLKQCIDAYRNQLFILPDPEQVRAVELGLRRIGNNINQITKAMHQGGVDSQEALRLVRGQLEDYDQVFTKALRSPWSLEAYLESRLAKEPKVLRILARVLNDYVQTLPNDHQDPSA